MRTVFKLAATVLALGACFGASAQTTPPTPTGDLYVVVNPPTTVGDSTSPATGGFAITPGAGSFLEEIDFSGAPAFNVYQMLGLTSASGISVSNISLYYYGDYFNDGTPLGLNTSSTAGGTMLAVSTDTTFFGGSYSFFVTGTADGTGMLAGEVASGPVPVPEPGQWALLLAGLLTTGAIARARRRV